MRVFPYLLAICFAAVSSAIAVLAAEQGTAAEAEASPTVSIEELVSEALANNPELAFYLAEVAAAKSDRRTAGTRPNPDAEFELGRKRSTPRFGGSSHEGTAWAVSVSQSFDWPNRLTLSKAIAARQIDLAEIG